MRARLNVDGTDLAFANSLAISVNMKVADIREPDKRNSSYSKTIVIPGTHEANQVFEYAFETNIVSNTFNAKVKVPAEYYVNEVRVFNGDLQLLRIRKKYNGTLLQVEYECSIVGETGNLFLDISNSYLTDLDFSEYDHTLTYASGLFNPTLGSGYCYPYIDYGQNTTGAPCSSTWTFEHLKPAIFELEYIDKIFAAAGYTYTSSYLSSTYAKSIVIPDINEGPLKIDAATQAASIFYAGRTTGIVNNVAGAYNGGVGAWAYAASVPAPGSTLAINTDSGGAFYDPGADFDTATYTYTQPISAYYQYSASAQFTLTITPPAGTASLSIVNVGSVALAVDKSTNGGSSWAPAFTSVGVFSGTTLVQTINVTATVPPALQASGTLWRVRYAITGQQIIFYDNTLTPITTGTSSIDIGVTSNCTFGNVITSAALQYGGNVVMNQTVPTNVKQIDFLTSIIKSENLYIELDKNNPNNYIIEPREDFILDAGSNPLDVLDWTSKLDVSKVIEVIPMGDLDAKKYLFTYKSDKDYYNQQYEAEFKEVYGTEQIDVDTDFIKNEKKIELIFSATPIAGTAVNDIVAARMWTAEDANLNPVKSIKCNIRRLYWGGNKSCATHTLMVNGSATSVSTYPFAGHVDDPMAPTLDLSFDNPLKLYWILPGSTITDNNRYNARYSKFISEITDRDSKIVKAYFYLRERDIAEFSFRKPIFCDGTYYFCNQINDYDPSVEKTVIVELLKLKAGVPFVPADYIPEDLDTNRVMGGTNTSGNYNGSNGSTVGTNNINNSSMLVIGSNNIVYGV